MSETSEISNFTKGTIVGIFKLGHSLEEIAQLTDLSEETVSCVINEWQLNGDPDTKNKPKTSTKRKKNGQKK